LLRLQKTGFYGWIFDDVLKPIDAQKIKDLDVLNFDIILCKYEYCHDQWDNVVLSLMRERIIRRSLNLRWEQPIHEHLPLTGRQFKSDIEIHHYKQAGNSERNIKILENIYAKNKKDSRNEYYLGKEYYDFNRKKEAKPLLQRFVNRKEAFHEDRYHAALMLADIHWNDPDSTEFKRYIFKCFDLEPRHADAYYYMGQYFMDHKSWVHAIHWFKIALQIEIPRDTLGSVYSEYHTWRPALQLCVCYNNLKEWQKAYDANEIVLKYVPKHETALNNRKILYDLVHEKKDGQGKKLNLGCGKKVLAGYENADNFSAPYIDAVYNLYDIPYTDETISEISTEHAIEHCTHAQGIQAIHEWFRCLKPGGVLNLKLPDAELCMKNYLDAKDDKHREWYHYTVHGYQKALADELDESQIHRWSYSKSEIRKLLESTGFTIDYLENYDGFDTPSIAIRAMKPVSPITIRWIATPDWNSGPIRIRILQVDRWLRAKGFMSSVGLDFGIFDITIVGKQFDESIYNKIKILKDNGKLVYCDLCENILGGPWVNEILKACDKVITCSTVLAELVKPINSNVVVIPDGYET